MPSARPPRQPPSRCSPACSRVVEPCRKRNCLEPSLQVPPPPHPLTYCTRARPRSYHREFAERTGTAAPATLSRISKLLLLRRVRTPTAPTSMPFLLTMAASRTGKPAGRGGALHPLGRPASQSACRRGPRWLERWLPVSRHPARRRNRRRPLRLLGAPPAVPPSRPQTCFPTCTTCCCCGTECACSWACRGGCTAPCTPTCGRT